MLSDGKDVIRFDGNVVEHALPQTLIRDLDGVSTVVNAFAMLGIGIGDVVDSEGSWIRLAGLEYRFMGLKFRSVGEYAASTTQLLLQCSRIPHEVCVPLHSL